MMLSRGFLPRFISRYHHFLHYDSGYKSWLWFENKASTLLRHRVSLLSILPWLQTDQIFITQIT